MNTYKELLEKALNEAKKRKPAFGTSEGFNYAVNIDSLDSNEFFKEPFGRRMGDMRKVNEWSKTAKKGYAMSKGKPTMASVKKWVKEMNPSEFYARWQKDSIMYKDDSVEILYKG